MIVLDRNRLPFAIARHFPRGCAVGWGIALQVAGSVSDRFIGTCYIFNASGRAMALGSTQPVREISTGDLPLGVETAGA
jgi:hypothetical protein